MPKRLNLSQFFYEEKVYFKVLEKKKEIWILNDKNIQWACMGHSWWQYDFLEPYAYVFLKDMTS